MSAKFGAAEDSELLRFIRPRASAFRLSCGMLGIGVGLAEGAAIVLAGTAAPFVYGVTGKDGGPLDAGFGVGLLAGILHAWVAYSIGLYRLNVLADPVASMRRHVGGCCIVLLCVTGLFFGLKAGAAYSRGTLAVFAAMLPVVCGTMRLAIAPLTGRLLAWRAIEGRPVFLFGEAKEVESLTARYLLEHFGLREAGRLVVDAECGDEVSGVLEAKVMEATRLAREAGAQSFLVAADWQRAVDLQVVERGLRASPLPVRLLPNAVLRSVIDRGPIEQDRSRHLVVLQRAPMGLAERASKRAFDLAVAAVTLAAVLPLLALVAAAIMIDSPGPVLFRQRRSGFDQRHFTILKFRTMSNTHGDSAVVQAVPGDRRVTRVGRMLRRSSIDELPQLVNVLKGEMSLVGPRPHALAHDQQYRALIGDYAMRHHVRPGLTGWAQVNGERGETARTERMARRVGLDLWYIRHWSLLLDVQILGRTVVEVLSLNAY